MKTGLRHRQESGGGAGRPWTSRPTSASALDTAAERTSCIRFCPWHPIRCAIRRSSVATLDSSAGRGTFFHSAINWHTLTHVTAQDCNGLTVILRPAVRSRVGRQKFCYCRRRRCHLSLHGGGAAFCSIISSTNILSCPK